MAKYPEMEWIVINENCHSLSYAVNNLEVNSAYSFRVKAFNKHGSSKPSHETCIVHMNSQGL